MSDRDNRRNRDPLHPDADATWDDDVTPVGKPSRRPRRAVTPPPVALTASGEIDTSDIREECSVDVRWAEFDEIRDEVRRCKADRIATAKRRRWILGAVLPSGGAVLGLLIWAVSQLDARADAGAQERLRIQAIQRHDVEIRTLQDWRIRAETLLGLRVGNNP